MKFKFVLFLLIVICLFSCQQNIETIAENGKTFEVEYFPNGLIKRKTEIHSGLKYGHESTFYSSGLLESYTSWKEEELPYTHQIYFYNIGDSLNVVRGNDTIFEVHSRIKSYYFINMTNDTVFNSTYTIDKDIINIKGKHVGEVTGDKGFYQLNDSIEVTVYGVPPFYHENLLTIINGKGVEIPCKNLVSNSTWVCKYKLKQIDDFFPKFIVHSSYKNYSAYDTLLYYVPSKYKIGDNKPNKFL